MVHSYTPIPLDCSLEYLLRKVLCNEEALTVPQHELSLDLLKNFRTAGCDYFDLLAIMSSVNSYTAEEIETMISLSPKLSANLAITPQNIRECIPRWTASKYHSAPIADVVTELEKLLTENKCGITLYNSNLNLRDKQSVNDQYILLISKNHRIFLDVNRKISVGFEQK